MNNDSTAGKSAVGVASVEHHHHHHHRHHHHRDNGSGDAKYQPHLEHPKRVKRFRWAILVLVAVLAILLIDFYIYFLK